MNRHVELLARYNIWRKGDSTIMPASVKAIEHATDVVIEQHSELLEALEQAVLEGYNAPAYEAIAKAKGEKE